MSEYKADRPRSMELSGGERDKLESDIIDELMSLDGKMFVAQKQIGLDIKMENIWGMLKAHNRGLKRDPTSAQPLEIKLTGNDKTSITIHAAHVAPAPVIVYLYKHMTTGYLELRANKWGPIIRLAHAPDDAKWEAQKKEYRMKTAFDEIIEYFEVSREFLMSHFSNSNFISVRDKLCRMVDDYNRLFGFQTDDKEKRREMRKLATEPVNGLIPERNIAILELLQGDKSHSLYVYHLP